MKDIQMTAKVDGMEHTVKYRLERYDGDKAIHTMIYDGIEVTGVTFDQAERKIITVIRNTIGNGEA
jgi:hypothetical protein